MESPGYCTKCGLEFFEDDQVTEVTSPPPSPPQLIGIYHVSCYEPETEVF